MNKINTIATGINLPPILLKDKVVIINMNNNGTMAEAEGNAIVSQQYPLTLLSNDLKDFVFPIDPIISRSFRNIITRRTVAKGKVRGTIKERWTEDDVQITITGVLSTNNGAYPAEVAELQKYFEYREQIDVQSPFLNARDIFSIVIETLDLPPTKGLENQSFQIKGYSDDVFNLLIEQ